MRSGRSRVSRVQSNESNTRDKASDFVQSGCTSMSLAMRYGARGGSSLRGPDHLSVVRRASSSGQEGCNARATLRYEEREAMESLGCYICTQQSNAKHTRRSATPLRTSEKAADSFKTVHTGLRERLHNVKSIDLHMI